MNDSTYRTRLRADLARWETEDALSREAAEAVRAALGPDGERFAAAHYAAAAAVILFGAAVLVFVAANWQAIPRLGRLGLLCALIVACFAAGAVLDRKGKAHFADLAATLGSVAFGASIALVGQMYHLPKDLAGGFALWSLGAFVAAALTGSRGAFAVAAVAGVVWTSVAMNYGGHDPQFGWWGFWLALAALAIAWNAPSARHLAAIAFFAWWGAAFAQSWFYDGVGRRASPANFAFAATALALGAAFATRVFGTERMRAFGDVLGDYAAFFFTVLLFAALTQANGLAFTQMPGWMLACALLGMLGLGLTVARRRAWRSPAAYLAALAVTSLIPLLIWRFGFPFGPILMSGALALVVALLLLVAGAVGVRRARLVAGWVAFASVVVWLAWIQRGGLMAHAVLLGLASVATVGLAWALHKFVRAGDEA